MKAKYDNVKGYEHLPEKTVLIEDIGVLVLEHQQVTLTHYLLDKLVQNNMAVITCDEKMPISQLPMLYYPSPGDDLKHNLYFNGFIYKLIRSNWFL